MRSFLVRLACMTMALVALAGDLHAVVTLSYWQLDGAADLGDAALDAGTYDLVAVGDPQSSGDMAYDVIPTPDWSLWRPGYGNAGMNGGSVQLDGVSGFHTEAADPNGLYGFNPAKPFTVEGWFKLDIGGGEQTIVATSQDGQDGWWVAANASDQVTFGIQALGATVETTSAAVTLNAWHHFAARWDVTNSECTLYVDGTLAATMAGAPAWTGVGGTEGQLSIGIRSSGGMWTAAGLTGSIDEIRFVNDAVPPDFFLAAGAGVGTTAYWQFDGNTDDAVDDDAIYFDVSRPEGTIAYGEPALVASVPNPDSSPWRSGYGDAGANDGAIKFAQGALQRPYDANDQAALRPATDVDFLFDPEASFTVEGWIKPQNPFNFSYWWPGRICGVRSFAWNGADSYRGWTVNVQTAKYIQFYISVPDDQGVLQSVGAASKPIEWDQVYHFACVYDHTVGDFGQLQVFLNGQPGLPKDGKSWAPGQYGTVLSFGARLYADNLPTDPDYDPGSPTVWPTYLHNNSNTYFGWMDEFRFTKAALTPSKFLLWQNPLAYIDTDFDRDGDIDLLDFAILSASWMECTDPLNPSCQQLYPQP